ncbi:hypothetical protein BDR26DRAFT_876686 [Obelidium mucronatum]|nr:hypothetical protein BDR26DRAFT_876686 [Obelidium mucronatum]
MALSAPAAPVDPCAALVANPIYEAFVNSVSAVEACYNLFPVSPAGKKAQVDALKSYFNFYPYKDIIQHSSAPYYPSAINLYKELDAITTNAAIRTEYQMQNAIKDTLAKLQDGHVAYLPLCFDAFRYYQPFQISPVFADDGPHFYVDKLALDSTDPIYTFWTKAFAGSKPSDFIGARINTINKQDPTEYLQEFADLNNGIGHSPEARFNTMFPSYKWPNTNTAVFFSFTRQRRARKPTTYEFQFANGDIKELTFEWAALLNTDPAKLTSAGQYYESSCVPPPPPPQEALEAANKASKRKIDPIRSTVIGSLLPGPVKPAIAGAKLLQSHENAAYFLLDDKKTGVWVMADFLPTAIFSAPDDQAPIIIAEWIKNMTSGLLALEKAGATRLIIDVTNNGGGLVCSGWKMANFLFPKANFKPLQYQARLTQPLSDIVMASPEIADAFFLSASTLNGTRVTDYANQIIYPGQKIKGYPHMNSNRFLANLDQEACPAIPASAQLKKGWLPKNVLIVSNGVCGSTCAQFTTYLRDQVGVRTVTYGGGYKRSAEENRFDPTAFAAGDVLPFGFFQYFFGLVNHFEPTAFQAPHRAPVTAQDPEDSMLPLPFPFAVNPQSQIPFLTSYSPKPSQPDLPVEWIIDPSEFYLNNVNLGSPASVWKAVLDNKLFESSISRTQRW